MKIDAEKAFALMYELFKDKPWLNTGGIMKDEDAPFEQEALLFLLKLETADSWGNCSEPARRVVNSLLLDFMGKLRGPFSHRAWEVPAGIPPKSQVARIIHDEIYEAHPRLLQIH